MAEYSVTLEDLAAKALLGNPKWNTVVVRMKAVSAKHAMAKAEKALNLTQHAYQAKSAQRVPAKFAETDYWRKIWAKAYNNMPTRVHVQKLKQWHEQKRGSVTMPEFIKGAAHGTMQHGQNGMVLKKIVVRNAHKMGALNALTKLLEYAKWNRQHSMAHYAVSNAMARGSRPRTPERRELLIKLAGPNGMAIAAEMLSRPFRPLKIKGMK